MRNRNMDCNNRLLHKTLSAYSDHFSLLGVDNMEIPVKNDVVFSVSPLIAGASAETLVLAIKEGWMKISKAPSQHRPKSDADAFYQVSKYVDASEGERLRGLLSGQLNGKKDMSSGKLISIIGYSHAISVKMTCQCCLSCYVDEFDAPWVALREALMPDDLSHKSSSSTFALLSLWNTEAEKMAINESIPGNGDRLDALYFSSHAENYVKDKLNDISAKASRVLSLSA